MNSKKSEAVIFEADPNVKPLPLTDDQIDAYVEQISKEQQKLLGDKGVLNDGQPIFYLLDEGTGQLKFFGHTRMFRIPYPKSPLEYVPEYARPTDAPEDPDCIDYAEAMFGYTHKTGKGKQRAYAGRISCSDGKLIAGQENIWLSQNPVTLHILSSPKPTTFQHYLVQQEPDLYPIGQTKGGETKYETHLQDFESKTPDDTVIRGNKFYWHKGVVTQEDIQEKSDIKESNTQHTRVHPLKPGVRFSFKLNFQNLSLEELGALMLIFNIAADKNIRLKIGMGKPLGMGSISMHSSLFVQQPLNRYGSLFSEGQWTDGIEPAESLSLTAVKAFVDDVLKVLNEGIEPEDRVDNILKIRRIRALLTMLQWPGPDKDWTRYMEIEHPDPNEKRGKRNEYKERPVLPPPFGVWSKKKND